MAANINDALDKNIDTRDDETLVGIAPASQATHIYLFDEINNLTFLGSLADVKAVLFQAVKPNKSPVVTLNITPNGITVGQSAVFNATATDSDGVIVAGTFYIDGVPVAVLTAAPFAFTYTPTSPNAVGTHQVEFVGLDNGGATGRASLPLVVIAAPVATVPTPFLAFVPVGNKNVNDPAVTLSATSTNNGAGAPPITFVSSNGAAVALAQNGSVYTVTFPAAGTSTLTALQAAGNGFAAGSASQAVTVSVAALPAAVITFPAISNKAVGDGPFQLGATSTNTGANAPAITYTSSNPAAVSVSGSTATVVGAGTATITASQAAGNGYAAANNATQNVTVTAAAVIKPTVSLELNPQSVALGNSSLLVATPFSSNSTIASVTFFDGGVQIGQPVTAQPWQLSYTPQQAGQRQITVRATDALGVVSDPSGVQVLTVAAAPVAYDTTLDATNSQAFDMVFAPDTAQKLKFNKLLNLSGNPVNLSLTDSSDGSVSYAVYAQEYGLQNRTFDFVRANGTTFSGSFPSVDGNINA